MTGETLNGEAGGAMRAIKMVVPWAVLAVVVMFVLGAFQGFRTAQDRVAAQQAVATSTVSGATTATASTATTLTGYQVVVVKEVKLRATPSATSEVLATVAKGAVMTGMLKDGSYLKVRDDSGHVGWVPNDTDFVVLRKKK